jgi:hypothetical protein
VPVVTGPQLVLATEFVEHDSAGAAEVKVMLAAAAETVFPCVLAYQMDESSNCAQ